MNYKIPVTNKVSKEAEFCGSLFACADAIKLLHLNASGEGSYAKHVALGDLYDAISDAADDVTESIQGYKGLLNISIPASTLPTDCCTYVKGERTRITTAMSSMTDMIDIQNKLQDLIGVFSKTIYKLENLE
tara:strand:+ start:48708 stop:49103 length:396 start_codon:yes stop_codon:yes gene_type:complete